MTLYYLDELDGDDANSGLSPDKAFKTDDHLWAVIKVAKSRLVKTIEVYEGEKFKLE
jgi:hypothetical protein